jgi:colicin import membrane protein
MTKSMEDFKEMKTSKEVALTVAGIVALLTTGQTMVHAASNVANANQADSQLTMSVNDMVVASVQNEEIKFADQNIRVSSNTSVSSDKIADATKSGADKAAEKASKLAKETAAKEDAAEAKEKEEKAEAEAKAKEEAKQAEKALAAAEKAAAEAVAVSVEAAPAQKQTSAPKASAPAGSGSVYDQFIAAGGTPEMWQTIVVPESGGNPNAVSSAGYRGLGQTKEGWGSGSVAAQTQGMLGYASSRYGSVDGALKFRNANGWW